MLTSEAMRDEAMTCDRLAYILFDPVISYDFLGIIDLKPYFYSSFFQGKCYEI